MISNLWESFKRHPWVGAIVLIFIIALGVSIFGCVPENAMAKTTDDVKMEMAGDSLRVTVFYNLHAQADSVKYVVSSTNGKAPISRVGASSSGALVFMLLGPAEGETDTVTVNPTAYKAGRAFAQAAITQTYTRGVTPPPTVTDSVRVQEAMLDSKLIKLAQLSLVNGESCPAELRDYRRDLLIVPHGVQSAECMIAFNGSIQRQNIRMLNAKAMGYPWTAKQDSIWRADTTTKPELPNVWLVTDIIPNPMSGDTFLVVNKVLVNIATYRQTHPDFVWPPET